MHCGRIERQGVSFVLVLTVAAALGGEAAHGAPGDLLRTLWKPTGASYDYFGYSVATVGSNILVGARWDDTGAHNSGAAYLFDGPTGALLRTFSNPAPGANDNFGCSVAAVGNNVLVGAYGAEGVGAAYLFDGTTGALLRTFHEPTAGADNYFGRSVAAAGGKIIIGASNTQVNGVPQAGAVYLFDEATGVLLYEYPNPTPGVGDGYGQSVAAVGGNVLVGAWGDDTSGGNTGAAYLFSAQTGALLRTFYNPSPSYDDCFGDSVAAAGNNVLIGAPYADPGASNAGVAYLFDGASGALLQVFRNPAPAENGYFGWSLAAAGNDVLIGARSGNTFDPGTVPGVAYLFVASTGALLQTFSNPTGATGDEFGAAVAFLGGNVIVAAPWADSIAPNAGVVYIFEGRRTLAGDANMDGVVDLQDFSVLKDNFGTKQMGDANGDNVIDLQDFGILKQNFGLSHGATWEMGDFTRDGAVDLQDFGLQKECFGGPIPFPWTRGDFTCDGIVDLQDFGILKDNFGRTTGDVPMDAIPEPGTLALLALGGLAPLRHRGPRAPF